MSRFAFLDHPGPIAFAHRGGAGAAPENTLPAFAAAVELGYRYLETDVHATADGVLVAFHDSALDRVTDRTGTIHELTWAEVSRARVDGREPIPLFAELLDAFPDVRFNVDPKHDDSVDLLAAAIADAGATDRVCIGSFSDRRISRLRDALGPRLCTSLGPRAVARLRLEAMGLPAGSYEGACVQVPPTRAGFTLVTESFIRAAHRHDLDVHVWTIDEPAEMDALLDRGVDGIMTDQPRTLKQVLDARQSWY